MIRLHLQWRNADAEIKVPAWYVAGYWIHTLAKSCPRAELVYTPLHWVCGLGLDTELACARWLDTDLACARGLKLDTVLECARGLNLDTELECARRLKLDTELAYARGLKRDTELEDARALYLDTELECARGIDTELACARGLKLDTESACARGLGQDPQQTPGISLRHPSRPTTAITGYVIGLRKMSANWQLFVGAQMVHVCNRRFSWITSGVVVLFLFSFFFLFYNRPHCLRQAAIEKKKKFTPAKLKQKSFKWRQKFCCCCFPVLPLADVTRAYVDTSRYAASTVLLLSRPFGGRWLFERQLKTRATVAEFV